MNSIIPISSMAGTIGRMLGELQPEKNGRLDEETLQDIQGAARTIARRSEHLLKFTQQYRKLTHLPEPDRSIFEIRELLAEVIQLAWSKPRGSKVTFTADVAPEGLEVSADPELLEQVLINLVKNALQATRNRPNPQIRLEGRD